MHETYLKHRREFGEINSLNIPRTKLLIQAFDPKDVLPKETIEQLGRDRWLRKENYA